MNARPATGPDPQDPRIRAAIDELREMIRSKYPDAEFRVTRGEDPDGIYLKAIVDVEDTDEVFDVVVDRLLDVQVEDELPVYVIPLRTPERVAAMRRAAMPRSTGTDA